MPSWHGCQSESLRLSESHAVLILEMIQFQNTIQSSLQKYLIQHMSAQHSQQGIDVIIQRSSVNLFHSSLHKPMLTMLPTLYNLGKARPYNLQAYWKPEPNTFLFLWGCHSTLSCVGVGVPLVLSTHPSPPQDRTRVTPTRSSTGPETEPDARPQTGPRGTLSLWTNKQTENIAFPSSGGNKASFLDVITYAKRIPKCLNWVHYNKNRTVKIHNALTFFYKNLLFKGLQCTLPVNIVNFGIRMNGENFLATDFFYQLLKLDT